MFEGHDPYLVALSVVIAILGGYTGFGLAVEIVAEIPGVEPDVAADLVKQAHEFCPYSKATRDNIVATARVA